MTPAGPAQGPDGFGVSGMPDGAVPLTLLTGFLGAGKTTLVNHVLGGGLGIPVGVLVNDFGALNIDRALIAGESAGVFSLENGCICCTLRDDLVGSVLRLLDRPEAPQRVLLEASGIADPAPIVGTFMAPAFRDRLRLDGVVCVVDAEQALATPAVQALQLRQIGYSDLVILNKADLAGPARVAALADRIRREFSAARLLEAVRCAVPTEVMFSLSKLAPDSYRSPAHSRDPDGMAHGGDFESCSLEVDGAFCLDALHELPRRLPPSVYRAKGVLRVAGRRGGPDRRGILQVVGRRADLVTDRPWRPEDGASRLVFIGATGAMPAGLIEALARGCLSDVDRDEGGSVDNAGESNGAAGTPGAGRPAIRS